MVREAPTNPAVAERVELGPARERAPPQRVPRVPRGRLASCRPDDTQATARLLLYAVLTAHLTDSLDGQFLGVRGRETILHGVARR